MKIMAVNIILTNQAKLGCIEYTLVCLYFELILSADMKN